MNRAIIVAGVILIVGCASRKAGTAQNSGWGDTRKREVQFLDDNTYLLADSTFDKSYGYEQSNPIKVGGTKDNIGPRNERRFMNALLGPHGEAIKYYRAGSCCAFKTPNGLIDNMGLLDRYRLTWTGSSDTLDIYINMYDKGDLMIPLGLTAKKKK